MVLTIERTGSRRLVGARLGGARFGGARVVAAACGVLLAVLALAPSPVWADVGDYRLVEGGVVYLGNSRLCARPCVIKADLVYREIAEYREILDKGLTDKDVRYHFLMKKASEKFLEGVKQMAKELDLDLVAEVGAIKPAKRGVAAPTDRTDDVISRLR